MITLLVSQVALAGSGSSAVIAAQARDYITVRTKGSSLFVL